jgi:eukaryotic-like serine/threonine-protein kinase
MEEPDWITERWEEIKRAFEAVVNLDPAEQYAALDQRCGEDAHLKREVEALLESHRVAGAFLKNLPSPPIAQADGTETPVRDRVSAPQPLEHQQIGQYRIIHEIGHGGGGSVFLAVREQPRMYVALKVIRSGANSKAVERRFLNERQILARINHPNIAMLLDGGSTADGKPFFVMEFVDGVAIDKYCDLEGLSITKRLELFQSVCAAVAHAHRNGVVHRDLKPSKIMVTREGKPKLLDFGIAKLLDPEMAAAAQHSDTDYRPMTPEYASPEQFRGDRITVKSDIYSLGVILYELLTGHPPYSFDRGDPVQASNAICEREPVRPSRIIETDEEVRRASGLKQRITPEIVASTRGGELRALRKALKEDLDNIILMATRKEPWRRYATVAEFSEDIDRRLKGLPVKARRDSTIYRATKFAQRRKTEIFSALLFFGIVALIIIILTPPPTLKFTFITSLPDIAPMELSTQSQLALSPNGRRLVYVGARGDTTQLFLRPLEALAADAIPETEGGEGPFFSPDGQWVGFWARGKLKRVSLAEGLVLDICDVPNMRGATWTEAGEIIFAPGPLTGLQKVSAAGGTPEPFTRLRPGEKTHRFPRALPGRSVVLFTIGLDDTASYDDARVAAYSPDSRETRILATGTYPSYVPTGHLVYTRAGHLYAAPFDDDRLALRGPPVSVRDGVGSRPYSGAGWYSISSNGTLVYAPPLEAAKRKLVWVNREGNAAPLSVASAAYETPRIAPDGKRLVVSSYETGGRNLWVMGFENNVLSRFTGQGLNNSPAWSPDGSRIAFASKSPREEFLDIFLKSKDGDASAVPLLPGGPPRFPTSWSANGYLAFVEFDRESRWNIWTVSVDGDRRPEPVVRTPSEDISPTFSPDGKWLAYVSRKSGHQQVYVIAFGGDRREWQISKNGGSEPAWSPDGRELFFREEDRMLVARIHTTEGFFSDEPTILFERPYVRNTSSGSANYDVSRDGQRFLMIQAASEPSAQPLTVVVGWFEQLEHLPAK